MLLGEHASLAGADPGTGSLGPPGQCDLGFGRQRPEAHVGDEDRYVESERPFGVGSDHDVGGHRVVVEERATGELSGDDLDAVPARKVLAGDAHGRHRTVVTEAAQPVDRELVDLPDEGLLRGQMGVVVVDGVLVERLGPERQRMATAVRRQLRRGDHHPSVHGVALEAVEMLAIVVVRDTGVDAVVPPVYTAHDAVALDGAVGQEGSPVPAPTRQHREILTVADHHEVDAVDERSQRNAVLHLGPLGNGPVERRPRLSGHVDIRSSRSPARSAGRRGRRVSRLGAVSAQLTTLAMTSSPKRATAERRSARVTVVPLASASWPASIAGAARNPVTPRSANRRKSSGFSE